MAGLDISIDDILGRKRRQRREAEAAALAQSLLEKGAQPDTVNKIAQTYAATGEIKLPEYETKPLPYDPEVPEGRSTRTPFTLGKRKGLFGFDSATGKFTEAPTPEGMTDFEVRSYNVGKPPKQGYNIWTGRQTGEVTRREPNNTGTDHIIYVDPSAGGGRGGKDPDMELAKDTLKKYQSALLRGDDIPDEYMDSVRSAADKVGVDIAEVQKDPGLLDQVWNAGAAAASKVPGAPKVDPAKPKFGGSAVRFKPKGGKPLTKEKAQQFLQQAGGDKNKARALAKQAGYTF